MDYPLIRQYSQEDCGAACLASIAKHYGRTLTMTHTREAVGTGQLGTTLLGLRRGTEALGFYARSAATSPEIFEQLNTIPLPAIIHWRSKHWVVFYGKRGNKYVIADPAIGVRYLSKAELMEGWTDWVILFLQPDPSRFFALPDDQNSNLEKVWVRLSPYRTMLLEALLCTTMIGFLSLASPFFIQILTDDVLIRGDTRLLTGVVLAVITLYVIRSGLAMVSDNLIAHFAQRLKLGLILEFGQQILQLPLLYYETRRSGEVVSRLRDIDEINRLIARTIVSLPSALFIALVSFIVMLVYSWKLTLLAVVIAVIMTLSTIVFQPILQQKTRRNMVLETENQGILVETFKGALTLKVTTSARQFWDELQGRFGRTANLSLSTTQIGILNKNFSRLVSNIGGTVLLGLGSFLVISKELSVGQLLAFASLNRNIATLIGDLVDFVNDYVRVQTAHSRLQELITATPEIQGEEKKHWITLSDHADIVCKDLNFSYPGRVELLQDFNLMIPGGQVTALIGTSGCGKSTLAKVIAGLYPVQSGNIRLGSYNLQDLPLECLRQQIILVPQDAHFWSRSIIENFSLGNPSVTFEEIVKACQIAEADEFISKLPEKYQTCLGEFGSNLSGGQRQRLAIARAIVSDPSILILDESTAGLDPVNEAKLLKKLLWHRQGKTTILISHRPKVVQQADWIVLLDNGTLKLQGTQSDLCSVTGDHLEFLVA
jgi:ATP-binding cassette subfamily C protein